MNQMAYLDMLSTASSIVTKDFEEISRLRSVDDELRYVLIEDDGFKAVASLRGDSATELMRLRADLFLCAGGFLLGDVYGYKTEQEGVPVQDVKPQREAANTPSFKGSKAFLAFHNDITFTLPESFYKSNPDYTCLYCIREQDEPVYTYVLPIEKIIEKLSSEQLKTAKAPIFQFSSPYGYNEKFNDGNPLWMKDMPIITSDPIPQLQYTASGVNSTSAEGVALIKYMNDIVFDVENASAVQLQPGQMLLIDNRRALHARSSFTAKFDENDRWLRRIYVKGTNSLMASDAAQGLVIPMV